MDDDEWLSHIEAGLSLPQLVFLLAWRRRTRTWPHDARGDVRPVDEHDGHLVVHADLVDTTRRCVVLTIAAHFAEATVRCDRVHNQLFFLPATPTVDALTAIGSPAELADRSADWFEAILGRRVFRHEWHRRGGRMTREWRFANTGEALMTQGAKQSRTPDATYDVTTEWS